MKLSQLSKALHPLLVIIFIVIPIFSFAQDPGYDPDAPIDGGLSILLAAGIAYGAKKGYDKRKNLKNKDTDDV